MTSLNIIAGDNRSIPYRKELNNLTGSVTASILLCQLIYWSERNDFKPFYKYKEPPNRLEFESDEEYLKRVNPYRIGDSWCEELGFTKKIFDNALKRIAHHKNKAIPQKDIEEYPVKSFIQFWTDRNRVTYYQIVELEKLNELIKNLYDHKSFNLHKKTKGYLETKNNQNNNLQGNYYNPDKTKPKPDLPKSPKGICDKSPKGTCDKSPKGTCLNPQKEFSQNPKGNLSRIEESESTTETTTQHASCDDDLNLIFEKWEKTISATRPDPVKIPKTQKTPELARKAEYMLELISNNELNVNLLKNPIGFLLSDKTNPPAGWQKKEPIKFVKLNDGDLVEWNGQKYEIECSGFIRTDRGTLPPGRVQKLISEGEIKILAN